MRLRSVVWFMPLLLLLNEVKASSAADTSGANTLNIGAIFTIATINGKVASIAMNAAVDDINSDPTILGGRKLVLSIHDSNYSGFFGIVGALQYMETNTVAVLGPQHSVMAHIVSYLANELHVPFLSFTALDPTLSPLQYPYFVQTAPNDLYQMAAIAEMISYFNYKEVTVIYSDDEQNRNGLSALGDQLAERRCKISFQAAIPPDPSLTQELLADKLVNVRSIESRVIVLHTYADTGLKIFRLAKKMGMVESGYVWIATAWLSTVLDCKKVSPQDFKIMHGVLTLRPHTPDSKMKRAFISRWSKLSNGTTGLSPYGLYAYDTVWIIANALKAFLNQGGAISFSNYSGLDHLHGGALNLKALSIFDGGKQLLDNILRTNMIGLTGPIGFNPDRSALRPAFDIINVRGSGFRQIGYWSNYSGLSVVTPESLYSRSPNRSSANQQLQSVVWPGNTRIKPRGWVLPENGRPLKIVVPRRVSFQEFITRDNDTTDELHGFCIEVFQAAVKLLPYPVNYKFIFYGDGHANPSYSVFANLITSHEFDAVIGDITIVTNRTKVVDFTQPYIESGLVIVIPVRKLSSSAWVFLRPFSPPMWAVTATFFIIVGAVVWILEHRINDEFRGPPKQQLVTILWFSLSTMFFSHRENTVSSLGRMVLVIWLFVVLIITSSYTASLTSILTVQRLSSSITGIESLINSNRPIGFQVGSFAENYLNEELGIAKSRLVPLGSPEAFVAALRNGTVAAIVDERPYVDLFLSNFCGFQIVGQDFTKSGWGFAFPRDSPLAVDMSIAILGLSENGELQRIHDRWLKKGKCSLQNTEVDSNQLQLRSFWGLFVVCGVACLLSLLVYMCQTLRQFKRYYPPTTEGTKGSRSVRLQRFLSFVDEKEGESKRRLKRKHTEMMSSGTNRVCGESMDESYELPETSSEEHNSNGRLR